jgi:hypothetical protein
MRSSRNIAKFVEILMTVGGTTDEIMEHTGYCRNTVYRQIKALREIPCTKPNYKLLPIVGWAPDARGAASCPVYRLGEGRDVPRHAMSDAQRTSLYRQRKARFAPIPTMPQGHSECLGENVV